MKKILFAFLCLSLAVILSACSPLEAVFSLFGGKSKRGPTSFVYTDDTDTPYLSLVNGETLKIADDATFAALTPDGKRAVYLQPDGKETAVILLDVKSGKKKTIHTASQNQHLLVRAIGNNGVFFLAADEEKASMLVYDFKRSDFTLRLEEISAFDLLSVSSALQSASDPSFSFGYIHEKAIFTFTEGDKEPTKLYTVSGAEPELLYVSNKGKTVVWSETSGKSVLLRMAYRGKVSVLVRDLSIEDDIQIAGTADGGFFALYTGNEIHMIRNGKELTKARCTNTVVGLEQWNVYTDRGQLIGDSASLKGIYLELDDVLYYLNTNGEKEKILSNLGRYVIRNNRIFYIQNEVLYLADIKNGLATDRVKLGADVLEFEVSSDGEYVYFLNAQGTLHAYRCGDDTANRVAADIPAFYSTVQGDRMLYFTDCKTLDNSSYVVTGTLMEYSHKTGESRRIAYDVELTSLHSANVGDEEGFGFIDLQSFEYLEYAGKVKEEAVFDLRYYNGKRSATVLESVTPFTGITAYPSYD